MKKLLVLLTCVMALSLSAVKANAISLAYGDAYYLGSIVDGIPPSEANEEDWVEHLTTMGAGDPAEVCVTASDLCSRVDSTVAGPFPTPVEFGSKNEAGSNTVSGVNGYQYVLAKYGGGTVAGGSYVWFIAGGITDNVAVVPGTAFGGGVSHVSFFNQVSVPDGGATLLLLGGSLLGLGALRRKFGV